MKKYKAYLEAVEDKLNTIKRTTMYKVSYGFCHKTPDNVLAEIVKLYEESKKGCYRIVRGTCGGD